MAIVNANLNLDSNNNAIGLINPKTNTLIPLNGYSCEAFGASPSATASSNVTAIQAALNAGGLVTLNTPGVYQINNTLTINSDTSFIAGEGVTLLNVTGGPRGSNTFTTIINKNANSTPVPINSIVSALYSSSATMSQVTVTFASAHGLSVGNYCQIKGDGSKTYDGIWEVATVPTSTTLTFIAGSIITTPSATAVASASQTVATPSIFTTATNAFSWGQPVVIAGTAPTGFTSSGATTALAQAAVIAGTATIYYVINTGLTTTACELSLSPTGTGIGCSASSACTLVPVLQGSAADGNIQISGNFVIDAAFYKNGFTASTSTNDHAIVLRRTLNTIINGVQFNEVRKYSIMNQDTVNPQISNVYGNTVSDGIHIYGPAWNPLIQNISGNWGDDVAIFQTIDGAAYLSYMLGSGFDRGGNIYNGKMDRINSDKYHNSGSCVLYPNGNSGATGATNQIYYMLGQQVISNIPGTGEIAVGSQYVTVAGSVENIVYENCQAGPRLFNTSPAVTISVGKVTIRSYSFDAKLTPTYTGSIMLIDYFTIDTLSFESCRVVGYNAGGSSIFIGISSANVNITNINFNDCIFQSNNSNGLTILAVTTGSPTLNTMNFINCKFGTNVKVWNETAYASTPTLNIVNCNAISYNALITLTGTQSLNANISNFTQNGANTGMFNLYSYTGTLNLSMQNINILSGTVFANTGGTINFTNPDGSFPINLTSISRKAGAIAKASVNTGSGGASDILANNLAVCDATNTTGSWKQISAPTTRSY